MTQCNVTEWCGWVVLSPVPCEVHGVVLMPLTSSEETKQKRNPTNKQIKTLTDTDGKGWGEEEKVLAG